MERQKPGLGYLMVSGLHITLGIVLDMLFSYSLAVLFLPPRGDKLGDFCSCGRKKKNLLDSCPLTMNEVDYLLFRNV